MCVWRGRGNYYLFAGIFQFICFELFSEFDAKEMKFTNISISSNNCCEVILFFNPHKDIFINFRGGGRGRETDRHQFE